MTTQTCQEEQERFQRHQKYLFRGSFQLPMTDQDRVIEISRFLSTRRQLMKQQSDHHCPSSRRSRLCSNKQFQEAGRRHHKETKVQRRLAHHCQKCKHWTPKAGTITNGYCGVSTDNR